MTHLRTTTAATLALWTIAQPLPAAPQAPAKPAAPKAAPRKPAAAKPAKPAPQAAKQPEVLNNDAILRMVAAGLDEETILTKIKTAPITDFALDADNLIKLKEGKTPQRVLRAMLAAKAPAAEPAPVKDPGPSTIAATEPAPAPEPPAPAIPAVPDQVLVRQGASLTPLSAKPQKIMFIKSEAGDMKTAVANILLSDVGLQLLTMGMSSQMKMWNPYMGDTIRKAAVAGKGILLNRENETKGFEIETLPGLTAETTLKEGKTEFYIPLTRYIPSADFDPAAVEPVLLRLQPRDADQNRVLSGRKVTIKQEKKGRFDLKPTNQRNEGMVEQTIVPIAIERLPDNVLKVQTTEDLKRGEYGLVFRKKDPAGAQTTNVALKPDPKPTHAQPDPAAAAIPGMTPEMMAMLGPEQVAAIQQQMQMQQQQQQPRGGLMGRMRGGGAQPPPAPLPDDNTVTGFLVWDFRVLP